MWKIPTGTFFSYNTDVIILVWFVFKYFLSETLISLFNVVFKLLDNTIIYMHGRSDG